MDQVSNDKVLPMTENNLDNVLGEKVTSLKWCVIFYPFNKSLVLY